MTSKLFGLDFGTSNSSIAWVDHANTKPALVNLERSSPILPSCIFYSFDEFSEPLFFGAEATEYFTDGEEGRYLRSLKSLLGTKTLDDKFVARCKVHSFQQSMEQILSHIKQTAEAETDSEIENIVVGRPVFFVDNDEEKDRIALSQLHSCLQNVGFKNIEFQYEPIAASLQYEQTLAEESIVLVIDIGGGTSDISVIRLSPEKAKQTVRDNDCLANTGIHIGGNDFDRGLNLKTIMPLMGYQQPLINKMPMPSHFFNQMTTWHLINNIYAKKFIDGMQSSKQNLVDQSQADLLDTMLKKKLAFDVALFIEKTKIDLSFAEAIECHLDFLQESLTKEITQNDLLESMDHNLRSIADTIHSCLKQAGLSPDNIDRIFLTGGSAQMKVLQDFIGNLFPGKNIDNHDNLSSVSAGLAIDARNKFAG